jgi:hypothetical protein
MPSGFGFTREGVGKSGNLYRTQVPPAATVMQREAELKDKVTEDKVATHTDRAQ